MQLMSAATIRKTIFQTLCLIGLSTSLLIGDAVDTRAAETASREEHQLIGDTILAGNLAGIKKLIEQDPERLNRLYRGRGILYYPAAYRQPEILEYLLEKGADASPQDRGSPLMDAVGGPNPSSVKCIEILLKYGAPVDNGFISRKDKATPYFIALRRGDFAIATLFLTHGADGSYLTKFDDNALTYLLRDRKNSSHLLEIVRLAVQNQADVNHEVKKN